MNSQELKALQQRIAQLKERNSEILEKLIEFEDRIGLIDERMLELKQIRKMQDKVEAMAGAVKALKEDLLKG